MSLIEQSGATYQGSNFAKSVFISGAKHGKSCFVIASALGLLPWQKRGGVVDKPENLHVIAVDANSLGGIKDFLIKSCAAPEEALNYRVYNLQDSVRRQYANEDEYSMLFYNDLMVALTKIKQRAKGVSFVHLASLTGAAMALERGVVGPPGGGKEQTGRSGEPVGKGYSDQSKWKALEHRLFSIQNSFQVDDFHMAWEAHIDSGPPPMGAQEARPSIRVSGSAGRHWATNAEQVFSIRRKFGTKYENTAVDFTVLDTRGGMEALQINGRRFNEMLDPEEKDLTKVFMKLGLKVGNWGAESKKKAVEVSK